jgi:AcrR family transcriptional regulator
MQRLDEAKRIRIRRAAAALFAKRPYHRVSIAEVAAAAHVGKGTIYAYFEDKEDLFLASIVDDLRELADRLQREAITELPPREALRAVVLGLVEHAHSHAQVFELMRTVGLATRRPGWTELFRQLVEGIETIIRRGVAEGVFVDPRPDLTALFVPGFVRSVMVYGPGDLGPAAVSDQILFILERALAPRGD